MATKYDLSLIIKAVDKATEPLRKINARIAKFTAPIKKLNNAFRALGEEAGIPRLMKGLGGVGSAVGRVGREALKLGTKLAGMAAAATYGFYAILKGAVDAGDELATMAQRVGLTVDAYAQLQYAAAQADVDQEQFNASMDQFNKRLGEAKAGGGPLLAFLQKVAPRLALQVKGAKSSEEALALMTDAFEKVQDPGKRAALAAAAFGKSGLQMGQFLGQGNKALQEQRDKYFALAGSQEKFAAGASDLDNTMRETGMAFLGLRNAAMAELFPALKKVFTWLTNYLSANREKLVAWAQRAAAAISAWVESGGMERLAVSLGRVADAVVKVVNAVGGLGNAAAIIGTIASLPLIASIVQLGGALWSLGGAVLPLLAKAAIAAWPAIAAVGTALGSALVAAAPFLAAAVGIGAAGYAIWKNWSELGEIFTTWQGALNALRTVLDLVWKPLESIITAWKWWSKQLGFGGPAKNAVQSSPAGPAGLVGAPAGGGQASVSVSFENLPKGARVTTDPGQVPLSTDIGYAMVPGG